MYIPMHVHSEAGSIKDSVLKIDEYIDKAKKLKLPAISITEHGSMASMYKFYFSCIEKDIKPIIGCEVYENFSVTMKPIPSNKKNKNNKLVKAINACCKNNYHLVLLAMNNDGLKDLLYITSKANLDGFYYKPRTDILSMHGHGDNIIALSACVGGRIPQELLKAYNDEVSLDEAYETCTELIKNYKEVFYDFYLELQPGEFEEQVFVNSNLIELSKLTDTKLIITNDVHYLDEEDYYIHDISVKLDRKIDIENHPELIYPDKCYYLMDEDDLRLKMSYIDKDILDAAIKNTEAVSRMCNINIDAEPKFPKISQGIDSDTDFINKVYDGFNEHLEEFSDISEYSSRLEYEIDTIQKLGYTDYFLIVKDFLDYCDNNDIPKGPGRGSCCGSLVSYLLGITKVDPIKYNLLFERFLHISRKSIPDIDSDIASSRRDEVFEYVINKYSKSSCALVSTFGIRKARSAIRDAGSVLNMDLNTVDSIAKLIPNVYYGDEGDKQVDLSISDSLEVVSELREYQKTYPKLFYVATKLENLTRSESIHAAGTLIAPCDLTDVIPLRKPNSDFINATSLDLEDAERFFVKMDFLALAYLDVIGNTEKEIGYKFDYKDFSDEEVWNLIGSKNTTGLFQIASNTYKQRMGKIKPRSIEELADALALFRGPCISQKLDKDYMDVKSGQKEIELIHPIYDKVTKETYGILLYQEQVLKLFQAFGFEVSVSYDMMKALTKKRILKIREYKIDFYEKGFSLNIDEPTLDKIWHIVEKLAEYSFNKSHAVAYAMLCYHSALLKIKNPKIYLKNALTSFASKDIFKDLVKECIRLGFKFSAPDANSALNEFTIDDNGDIKIGYCAIKSFGASAADYLIKNRPFNSFDDILLKAPASMVSKRDFMAGIFSGVFSCFEEPLEVLSRYNEEKNPDFCEMSIKISKDIINLADDPCEWETTLYSCPILYDKSQLLGNCNWDGHNVSSIFDIECVVSKKKTVKDRNKNDMCFITLLTSDGEKEGVIFSNVYSKISRKIPKNKTVKLKIKKDNDDKLIVLNIA